MKHRIEVDELCSFLICNVMGLSHDTSHVGYISTLDNTFVDSIKPQ